MWIMSAADSATLLHSPLNGNIEKRRERKLQRLLGVSTQ